MLGIDCDDDDVDAMLLDEEDNTDAVRAALRKAPKATGFDGVKGQVKMIMRNGYSVAQLLSQVRLFLHWPLASFV